VSGSGQASWLGNGRLAAAWSLFTVASKNDPTLGSGQASGLGNGRLAAAQSLFAVAGKDGPIDPVSPVGRRVGWGVKYAPGSFGRPGTPGLLEYLCHASLALQWRAGAL